jgi:uncharacterized protein YecE (DUF72 family)
MDALSPPEPSGAPRLAARLQGPLRDLAARNVYVGTANWRYKRWVGDVYRCERYLEGGRFSPSRFYEDSLAEYAETFHLVGVDYTKSHFPTGSEAQRLFELTPPGFVYALRVPRVVTEPVYRRRVTGHHDSDPLNPKFLSAHTFYRCFYRRWKDFADRVAVVIL